MNLKDECDIYNRSFKDDLIRYNLIRNSSNPSGIAYEHGVVKKYTIDFNKLQALFPTNATISSYSGGWFPLFISSDSGISNGQQVSYVDNKILSHKGSLLNSNSGLTSGRIGIENFISFGAQFKSWTTSEDCDMVTDWILNRSSVPHYLSNGIMCWAQELVPGRFARNIDGFPIGSRIKGTGSSIDNLNDKQKIIDSPDTKIKYKDDKILNTLSFNLFTNAPASISLESEFKDQRAVSLSGDINFLDSSSKISITGTGLSDNQFSPATSRTVEYREINSANEIENTTYRKEYLSLFDKVPPAQDAVPSPDDKKYILWIADGDYFSYFADENDSLDINSVSRSYVSPSLWSTYNQIYHMLSLQEIKSIEGKNVRKSRLLKKIAAILSTSPYISDDCINALGSIEIQSLVQKCLAATIKDEEGNEFPVDTTNDTVRKITIILHNKFGLLQKIVGYNNHDTLHNNIITNNESLFSKLTDKYGCKLKLDKDKEIVLSYRDKLTHGDSINIIQASQTLCPKGTQNTDVLNNQTISLDKLQAKTNLTTTNTSIDLTVTAAATDLFPLQSKTTKVPLYDIAIQDPGKISLNIILSQTTDGNATNEPQISPDNYKFRATKFNGENFLLETQIPLECIQKIDNYGAIENIAIFQSIVSCFWEQTKGPVLKFNDENKSSRAIGSAVADFDRNRFDNSTYIQPIIYVYQTGEYEVQCTFTTPYGTFTKRKTFFVVDGREKTKNSDGQEITNLNYDKYYDKTVTVWSSWVYPRTLSSSQSIPIIINSDKLRTKIASFKSIVLHKHGIFWPIQTDHYIEQIFAGSKVKDILKDKYKFVFENLNPLGYTPKDKDSTLTIKYNTQDTILKLDTIILKNIRNNTDQCKSCLSVCKPKFEALPSLNITPGFVTQTETYVRTGKQPDSFTLNKYTKPTATSPPVTTGTIDFSFPQISLDFAPPLRSYGGYSTELVSSIGLSISGNPDPGNSLVSITGYPLDYKADYNRNAHKACYQIPISATGYIPFSKGLFHPFSGFIMETGSPSSIPNDLKNKTSVLKFNPGARHTHNFVGPGIFNFNNSYSGSGIYQSITPILYKSAISLAISPNILPETSCRKPPRLNLVTDNLNKLHKEFMDQQINGNTIGLSGAGRAYRGSFHGYRLLEGGQEKLSELSVYSAATPVNDEFGFDISNSRRPLYSSNDIVESSTFNYRFSTNGPNSIIHNTGMQLRTKDLSIQDIEVKLNFLNYINPKNLMIWLDVTPCDFDRERMTDARGSGVCPGITSSEFMDQTFPTNTYGRYPSSSYQCPTPLASVSGEGLAAYMTSINELNSTDARTKPLKLVLINQDHIQNNKYNLSLTFSDHASKYNTLFDENKINPNGVNTKQEIVRDNHVICPTITATGFNDIEATIYKNIIRTNKLNISNNTFSKFKNLSLFKTRIPKETAPEGAPPKIQNLDPTYDSNMTFTLNILVLDESEEMRVYDNVINNEFMTNFTSTINEKASSSIYNSLCSWELILHTGKKNKYKASITNDLFSFGTSDVLGLLDYSAEPQFPGYNFISYFPSGENPSNPYISYFDNSLDKLSLIPRVNQNAPYLYINDSTLCQSAENILSGASARVQPPRFPIESLLLIVAGMMAGAVTGTLVGLMGSLTYGFDAGWQGLYDYFYSLREAREREGRIREVYIPDYDHYSFGSPEKTLLNVSKDGGIWYKLEAAIFKYKNTPSLSGNKYKFIRLKRGNIPLFSEFDYELVTSIGQLVDSDILSAPPSLTPTPTPTPSPTPLPGEPARGPTPTPTPTPTIPPREQARRTVQELQYNQAKTAQINCSIGYQKSFFDQDLFDKIEDKKIVIINGSLANNLLHIGDNVPFYKEGDRNSSTEPGKARILNKALIVKNNKHYTVLELDPEPEGDPGDLSKFSTIGCNGDTLLVFKDHISNLNEDPFGVWGLEKSPLVSEPPDIKHSAVGLGSYGDGSPFTKKEFLSYKLQQNKLYTIYEIFNNNINDKIKQALVHLKLSETNIKTVGSEAGFYGYGYTNRELAEIFQDKYNNIIDRPGEVAGGLSSSDALSYILYQLTNNTSNINVNGYTFMFLKSASFVDNEIYKDTEINPITGRSTTVYRNFGEIIVPEDLVKKPMIQKISDADRNMIINRLARIESRTYDSSIEDKLGNTLEEQKTKDIIDHGSIYYLQKHLDQLSSDPLECYKKTTINLNGTVSPEKVLAKCPQKRTQKALNDLYTERSILLQTLEINNATSSGIVPLQQFSISGNTTAAGTPGPIYVKLNDINQNLYWINIDPKQSCSIAEEMCPKILKSTTYNCIPLTETTLFIHANNNICADFLAMQKTKIEDGGEVNIEIANPFGNFYRGYRYSVPTEIIESQKTAIQAKYPSVFGWTEFVRHRTFNINTDKNLDGIWNGPRDIQVKVEEVYYIGLPEHMMSTTFIPSKTDSSADSQSVPGIDTCLPNGPGGLKGFGLLTAQNTRVPYTRVYNIFNLDDTNFLKVQFRKVPRQLRGVDLSNTVYRYGKAGPYRQTNFGNPPSPTELDIVSGEGSLNNDFYIWKCVEKDIVTKQARASTSLPEFLQLQNEMAFRAFYGSVDGIENKSRIMESLYAWELIPYEYFTNASFYYSSPTPTPLPIATPTPTPTPIPTLTPNE